MKILRKGYWTLALTWAITISLLGLVVLRNIKTQPHGISKKVGKLMSDSTSSILMEKFYPMEVRSNLWPSPPVSKQIPLHDFETVNVTQSRIAYNKNLHALVQKHKGLHTDSLNLELQDMKALYGFPKNDNGTRFMTPEEIRNRDKTVLKRVENAHDGATVTTVSEGKGGLDSGFKNEPSNAERPLPSLRGSIGREASMETTTPPIPNLDDQWEVSAPGKTPRKVQKQDRVRAGKAKPTGVPQVLSAGREVLSDVKGNLGPPSVVTNENMKDWLADRWQAASDMRGSPIPGPHWLQIDLGQLSRIESVFIDFETAYSKNWILYGRRLDTDVCPEKLTWMPIAQGDGTRIVRVSDQHITQHVAVIDKSNGDGGEYDCAAPNYSQVKLVIDRPSTRYGTSIWRLHINGLQL